jgi:hypothetical protein
MLRAWSRSLPDAAIHRPRYLRPAVTAFFMTPYLLDRFGRGHQPWRVVMRRTPSPWLHRSVAGERAAVNLSLL